MLGVALSRVAERRLMNYSSGSVDCALPMASKSKAGVCVMCRVSSDGRESTSATGLAPPLTCLMSAVNWEIKSR